MSPIAIVLTSSGVAALISGLITLLGQYLERRNRRDELIFTKALEMAYERSKMILDTKKTQPGIKVKLHDNIYLAETYYRWLNYLYSHGKLPDDAKETTEDGEGV
ncbi:MAG: hypothetical protein KBH94_05440 [Caldisericia bacterium]|nr:hypothetical protein [Caldisericia bacterium]